MRSGLASSQAIVLSHPLAGATVLSTLTKKQLDQVFAKESSGHEVKTDIEGENDEDPGQYLIRNILRGPRADHRPNENTNQLGADQRPVHQGTAAR